MSVTIKMYQVLDTWDGCFLLEQQMILENPEEESFWKAVYVGAIHAGNATNISAIIADQAVEDRRERINEDP